MFNIFGGGFILGSFCDCVVLIIVVEFGVFVYLLVYICVF